MNLEQYIEKFKNDEITLEDIPKELLASNSEKYFELFKEGYINFNEIPEEIMVKHTDEVFELYEGKVYIDFEEIPESVLINDPEKTIQFCIKNDIESKIPKKIFLENPKRALELCEEDVMYLEIMPESILQDNQEFCISKFRDGVLWITKYIDKSTLTHEDLMKAYSECEDFDDIIYALGEDIIKKDVAENIQDYTELSLDYNSRLRGILEEAICNISKDNPKRIAEIPTEYLLSAFRYSDRYCLLEVIPEELLNEELIIKAIESDTLNIKYLPEKYKENIEFKFLAYKTEVEYDGIKPWMFTEDELDNIEICKKIYNINNGSLKYLPEEVTLSTEFMKFVIDECKGYKAYDKFREIYERANINLENIEVWKRALEMEGYGFDDVYELFDIEADEEKRNEFFRYAESIGKYKMSLEDELEYGKITRDEYDEKLFIQACDEYDEMMRKARKTDKDMQAAKALRDEIAKEKGLNEQKRGE